MWRVLLCIACLVGTMQVQGATEVDTTCRSFVKYDGKKQCLLLTHVDDEVQDIPDSIALVKSDPTEGEVVEILPPTEIIEEE